MSSPNETFDCEAKPVSSKMLKVVEALPPAETTDLETHSLCGYSEAMRIIVRPSDVITFWSTLLMMANRGNAYISRCSFEYWNASSFHAGGSGTGESCIAKRSPIDSADLVECCWRKR